MHIDLTSLFKDTPIQKIHEENKFESLTEVHSETENLTKDLVKSVHHSDAIRLVLIYKYGGFYSDLDVVILKSLDGLKNVMSCDESTSESVQNLPNDFLGTKVSNAIFHFTKGSPFIKRCLETFSSTFDGRWGSGGPNLFQTVLLDLCNVRDTSSKFLSTKNISPEKCQGITVLNFR